MQNFPDNTLYEIDNLDVLRGMNSETVDLIATDPPFNTSRNRAGTAGFYVDKWKWGDTGILPDQWKWNEVHPVWLEQIKDENRPLYEVIEAAGACHGEDIAAFLCFLSVRLLEMRRVLKPNGSIYLHCDHTANAYIRMAMDAIFGARNFRNEIVWKRTGSHGSAKRWGPIHDTIFFYAKSSSGTWNPTYQDYDESYLEKYYTLEDERGRYQLVSLTGAGIRKGDSGKPWHGVDPTEAGRHWAVPMNALRSTYPTVDINSMSVQDKLDLLEKAGLIVWPKRGKTPRQKRYASENPGVPVQDIVDDISAISAHALERTGSPDQKPIALYERIILASSNPGDLVLDPFAGCMTTIMAARKHGRRWIGIDRRPDARFHAVCRLMGTKSSDVEKLMEGITDWSNWLTERLSNFDSHYRTEPPVRTDSGEMAPHLPPVYVHNDRSILDHREMKQILINQFLLQCWGCDFNAPDERYLELDHIDPRSQGGENHLPNRALLCGPCNKVKGNKLTLTALRRVNQAAGHLKNKRHPIDVKRARDWCRGKLEEIRRERERRQPMLGSPRSPFDDN